jgi:hypothetical protein
VSLKRLTRFVCLPELPPNRITNLDAEEAVVASSKDASPEASGSAPGVDKDVMLKVEKSDFRWAGPPPEVAKPKEFAVRSECCQAPHILSSGQKLMLLGCF